MTMSRSLRTGTERPFGFDAYTGLEGSSITAIVAKRHRRKRFEVTPRLEILGEVSNHIQRRDMVSGRCSGYHWSQGQYMLSDCTQESSTFFIILGFTMLVLVSLLFIIILIACIKTRRGRSAQQNPPLASQRSEDDCVVSVDGSAETGGSRDGRNLDAIKCVIMAGEEKPTFIAHPVASVSHLNLRKTQEQESNDGELSKEEEPSEVT